MTVVEHGLDVFAEYELVYDAAQGPIGELVGNGIKEHTAGWFLDKFVVVAPRFEGGFSAVSKNS